MKNKDKAKQSKAKQINCVASENNVKCMGYIDKGTGKHQSNCVYSVHGLSPTVCAGLGTKAKLLILEENE